MEIDELFSAGRTITHTIEGAMVRYPGCPECGERAERLMLGEAPVVDWMGELSAEGLVLTVDCVCLNGHRWRGAE